MTREEFTRKALALEVEWQMGQIMPMRNYSRKLFDDDDSLGIVIKDNPTRVLVGMIIFGTFISTGLPEEFKTVEELMAAGWLVD